LQMAQVPSFLLQDFWGEQNSFFGRGADRFLVLDAEAARLTHARHGKCDGATVIVGSPRHAGYARLDPRGIRDANRRTHNIPVDADVVGFFGQALHKSSGYVRTIAAWAEAVRDLPGSPVTLYKPHPREREKDRENTLAIFAVAGVECIVAD